MPVSMASALLSDIVARAGPEPTGRPSCDACAWRAFEAARLSLTRKLDRDATAAECLRRFVTASHDLTRDEIRWALEFIYSHLVQKYQGALGEFFAARELGAWLSEKIAAEELGAEVRFVAGDDILERPPGRPAAQWRKGADGLLLVDTGDPEALWIAGVVEIKSFPTTFARRSRQLESHLERLRFGLRLGDRQIARERLFPAGWVKKHGWRVGAKDDDWRQVLRVLVSTRRRAGFPPAVEPLSRSAHHLLLPVSQPTLAATAYELTVCFLEGLGATVFAGGSPWPDMTPGEAAINAVKEALYHLLREGRAGSKHATRVATRLYNVYGFGFATAEDQPEMLWIEGDVPSANRQDTADPPLEPPAVSPVVALVESAWSHYRHGRLAAAQELAEDALGREGEAAARRRIPWLLGMLHYYQADFQGTCRLLPEPGPRPDPDDGWWAKDLLTLARAWTRTGQLERAQALLARVAGEKLAWSYLAVALPAILGQSALAEKCQERARALFDEAYAYLKRLRAEECERAERGLGEPLYHDAGAIQGAVVDAAVLMCGLGSPSEAVALLQPMTGLFAPLLELVAVDPGFDPVRKDATTGAELARWIAERRGE
jgi:tetratricopeptide (TPR) repeat protein